MSHSNFWRTVKREIVALRAAMRQLGVVSPIFHQLTFDEWTSGTLKPPQARIKVNEKDSFGMIERGAVRNSASCLFPKHAAVAWWKHRALSFVEQQGVQPMPKDRGGEQGDIDGPLECSLALGTVAAEARLRVAEPQAV